MRFHSSRRQFFRSVVTWIAGMLGLAAAAKAAPGPAPSAAPKKLPVPAPPYAYLTYDRFPMGSICTTTYDAQGRMVSRTGPIPMAYKYR
jgi:hypothetical protein